MNDIKQKQNTREIIDRLAAQRAIYTLAKYLNGIHFILAVVIIIGIAIYKNNNDVSEDLLAYFSLYSIMVAFVGPLIIDWRKSLQMTAARIQTEIDTTLFHLSWDNFYYGNKVQPETIHLFAKFAKKYKLKDWYVGDLECLNMENATFVCQRQNISYDKRLRCVHNAIVLSLGVLCVAFLLMLAMRTNMHLWSVITDIVMLLPLLNWFYNTLKQCYGNNGITNTMKEKIETEVERWSCTQNKTVVRETLLQIQFLLFRHRSSSYLIPDSLYCILRRWFEEEASYSCNQIIDKLK